MVNSEPVLPITQVIAKLQNLDTSAPGPTIHPAETPRLQTHEATFLERMLQYMPLSHRTFLLHLSTHPTPLRSLVISHGASHPKLAAAYDEALAALQRFREKHMRVVSIFIVQQARRQPSDRIRAILGSPVGLPVGELRGTGGTALFKFLKQCRDNTVRAMIAGGRAGYDLDES